MPPKNYALPGNPNPTATRKQAIDWIVDAAFNHPEYEWASCSVKLKPMIEAVADLAEVAKGINIAANNRMILAAYDRIKNDPIMAY